MIFNIEINNIGDYHKALELIYALEYSEGHEMYYNDLQLLIMAVSQYEQINLN